MHQTDVRCGGSPLVVSLGFPAGCGCSWTRGAAVLMRTSLCIVAGRERCYCASFGSLSRLHTEVGETIQSEGSRLGPLSVDRLRFAGRYGHWRMEKWLGPRSFVPFVAPSVLRQRRVQPRTWKWPGRGTQHAETMRLYETMGSVGLLGVSCGAREAYEVSVGIKCVEGPV